MMKADISYKRDRKAINSLASVVGESRELADVLQKIVRNAGELLGVHSCSLALLDESRTELVTLAALLQNGEKLRRTRFRLNEGVAGWVAGRKESLIINNVSLDQRFKKLGRVPIGSIMCMPLIDSGSFIGTITASSQEIDIFDEKNERMLRIFAEQAVLAITNARNAGIAQRQAEQLETLIRLSKGITTRLESEELYRTILSNVRKLVSCDSAFIYLHQEAAQELYAVAEWTKGKEVENEGEVKSTEVQRERVSMYDTSTATVWAAIHRHPMIRPPMQSIQEETNQPIAHMAELAAPFVSNNVLYGVLSLRRVEPFSSDELRLVRNLSNMAAAALENAELFQMVRADQERLRVILEASSDGIALLDSNGSFLDVNPAFGRIFGLEAEQILGMECLELFTGGGDEGDQFYQDANQIRNALQQRQALAYMELDLQIHNMPHSLGLSINPISMKSRPLFLIVARDVTVIRDATRMKAKFISMITHELRSPLNAINGYMDLVLEGVGGELNAQQKEFIQRARAGSEHLFSLLEDLLLVTRADAGQLRLNRDIIDLKEVIINAVEELELSAADHQIAIKIELDRELPRLFADAGRLQQVLRNLISNALRFTPSEGNITVVARVEETPGEDEVERVIKLEVKDTGVGIATEYQERIFERFYQVPSSSGWRAGGQGLGLAIVKMIVELHGGYVTVESTPEQGSTFSCILPCL